MKVSCKQCGILFEKSNKNIKKSPNHFCSRSCAATFNNKKFPKRKRIIKICKDCGIQKTKLKHDRCKECDNKRRANKIDNMTIEEASYKNKWKSNKFARIRDRAKTVYADKHQTPCQNCGYDMHIEICHIRAISDFPSDTLIKVVNSSSNIAILCRNCHWELDSGLLKL